MSSICFQVEINGKDRTVAAVCYFDIVHNIVGIGNAVRPRLNPAFVSDQISTLPPSPVAHKVAVS